MLYLLPSIANQLSLNPPSGWGGRRRAGVSWRLCWSDSHGTVSVAHADLRIFHVWETNGIRAKVTSLPLPSFNPTLSGSLMPHQLPLPSDRLPTIPTRACPPGERLARASTSANGPKSTGSSTPSSE